MKKPRYRWFAPCGSWQRIECPIWRWPWNPLWLDPPGRLPDRQL